MKGCGVNAHETKTHNPTEAKVTKRGHWSAFNTITDNKDNRSMANSAAILSLPESLFDVVTLLVFLT
jgi:hypothetical protein